MAQNFNAFYADSSKRAPAVKGEDLARMAYAKLSKMILMSDSLPEEDAHALKVFYTLIGDNLNAFQKDEAFFVQNAALFKKIAFGQAPDAVDLSKIATTSEHGASPILKEEAEMAVCARNSKMFLMHFGSEKHKTLNALLLELQIKKGFENASSIWKPIGLGRKRWSNLINRYNGPSDQAPKLTLLQVAIGLRLTFEETNELLAHQCYRLTKDKTDLVFIYYIMNRLPFEREKNHEEAAQDEACAIRQTLSELGLKTIPEIYD